MSHEDELDRIGKIGPGKRGIILQFRPGCSGIVLSDVLGGVNAWADPPRPALWPTGYRVNGFGSGFGSK